MNAHIMETNLLVSTQLLVYLLCIFYSSFFLITAFVELVAFGLTLG